MFNHGNGVRTHGNMIHVRKIGTFVVLVEFLLGKRDGDADRDVVLGIKGNVIQEFVEVIQGRNDLCNRWTILREMQCRFVEDLHMRPNISKLLGLTPATRLPETHLQDISGRANRGRHGALQ